MSSKFRDRDDDAPDELGDPDAPDDPDDPDAQVPPRPTERRLEALGLAALGLQPVEAAAFMGITAHTYRNHVAELHSELQVKKTVHALLYSQLRGWVTLNGLRELQRRVRQWRRNNRKNS